FHAWQAFHTLRTAGLRQRRGRLRSLLAANPSSGGLWSSLIQMAQPRTHRSVFRCVPPKYFKGINRSPESRCRRPPKKGLALEKAAPPPPTEGRSRRRAPEVLRKSFSAHLPREWIVANGLRMLRLGLST